MAEVDRRRIEAMTWPEKPTCHGENRSWAAGVFWVPAMKKSVYEEHKLVGFRDIEPDAPQPNPYRSCSYCGSIHPADLVYYLRTGAELHGSDWKYGYPHKFYVERIPSPYEGRPLKYGHSSQTLNGERVEVPIIHAGHPYVGSKFYTKHLLDQGYGADALALLLGVVSSHSGVQFSLDPVQGVMYQAPYHGYQR